jgi:hypothetical protein
MASTMMLRLWIGTCNQNATIKEKIKAKKYGSFGITKDKIITPFKRERERDKEREESISQTESTIEQVLSII